MSSRGASLQFWTILTWFGGTKGEEAVLSAKIVWKAKRCIYKLFLEDSNAIFDAWKVVHVKHDLGWGIRSPTKYLTQTLVLTTLFVADVSQIKCADWQSIFWLGSDDLAIESSKGEFIIVSFVYSNIGYLFHCTKYFLLYKSLSINNLSLFNRNTQTKKKRLMGSSLL